MRSAILAWADDSDHGGLDDELGTAEVALIEQRAVALVHSARKQPH